MKRTDEATWKETFSINYRALGLWRKMAGRFLLALTLSTALEALAPYIPLVFTARLLDEIAGARDPARLTALCILLLSISTLTLLLAAACKHWCAAEEETNSYREAQQFFTKLLQMDFCAVDDAKTHDLLSQIRQNETWSSWGLPRVPEEYQTLLRGLIKIVCSAALSVSLFIKPVRADSPIVWINHPACILFVLASLLFATWLAPFLFNKGAAYWTKAGENVKLGNRLFSFFNYIAADEPERAQDIRIYEQEHFFHQKLESILPTLLTEKCRMARYAWGPLGLYKAAAEAVTRILNGVVYLFVCLKALGGAFGIGYITQYVGAISALSGGLSDCVRTLGDMRNNVPNLKLVMEFLDIPNTMYQGSLTTEKRSDHQYHVEFRDVSFRYPGSDQYALRHVSMKFRVGRRLAVVGENGSGKTTFIKLLCRLYDPTEGEILLNGINIRKYRYEDYLALFSVVFQDFRLLALPLGQNVAGARDYDAALAEKCLQKAGFAARLKHLPAGLDTSLYTDLDPAGINISGGEAQKIAIARALYKDAPFIILDEPTAALDPIAEAEIYSKFDEIAGDKTAIYISHRLSSCKFCDEIAVFHEGAVIQQGSHAELFADRGGKYYALWNAQAQYYTE